MQRSPSSSSRRSKVPNGWVFVVVGLLAAALGWSMWHNGAHHRELYQDFQRCKASDQPICVLEQEGSEARSEADYKKNYETQLVIGTILMAGGAVAVVAGAALVVIRRRSVADRPSAPPTAMPAGP